jgi:hypothetical protein
MTKSVVCFLCVAPLVAVAVPIGLRAQAPSRANRSDRPPGTSRDEWQTAQRDTSPRPRVEGPNPGTASDATNMPDYGRGERVPHDPPPAIETDSGRPSPRNGRNFADPKFVAGDQIWREYNLAPYTARLASVARPEQAVIDWTVKRTGTETWNGEDVSVLSATRARLRVFHRPDVQAQVAEIVERFIRPAQTQVSMRVQIVTTTDLDWRSGLAHLLIPAALGPDGQQAWVIPHEDVSLLRERLRRDNQAATLAQQHILATNGRPATIETTQAVNYIAGLELESGLYLAYQPAIARLNEGVKLSLDPLWTADGAAVDVTFRLSSRVVSRLHNARAVAPLSTGNQNTVVQVPEVSGTWFEGTILWPHSQMLLLSGGVQTGHTVARRGKFGLSSPPHELLVLIELDPPLSARATSRRPAATRERVP